MAKSKTSSTINALFKLAAISGNRSPASDENDNFGQLSFLLFDIGEEFFALAVENIEGVMDCPRIAPLPSPPDSVVGVTSARGRMTLVMDLSANHHPSGNRQRLVLLKGESQIGLLADRIEDVITLSAEDIEVLSKRVVEKTVNPRPIGTHYFKSKGKRVAIIDFDKLVEA